MLQTYSAASRAAEELMSGRRKVQACSASV